MTIDDIHHWDKLESVSNSPGYRDIGINITDHTGQRHRINLTAHDAALLHEEISRASRLAWKNGEPIDMLPGETRPLLM